MLSAGTVASRSSIALTACCNLSAASLPTGCLLRVAKKSWKAKSCMLLKVLLTRSFAELSLAALFVVAYSPSALQSSLIVSHLAWCRYTDGALRWVFL